MDGKSFMGTAGGIKMVFEGIRSRTTYGKNYSNHKRIWVNGWYSRSGWLYIGIAGKRCSES